jgi:hypothetical protein
MPERILTFEINYEVESQAAQDSGFNNPVDCNKNLHNEEHQHFKQFQPHEPGYIYNRPLRLEAAPEFISEDFCCICEELIEDPNQFVFNLDCQHSYHKYCINAALGQGKTEKCLKLVLIVLINKIK